MPSILLRHIDTYSNTSQQVSKGDMATAVSSLCIDSRRVTGGSVFIAVRGTMVDGHSLHRHG